MYTGLVGNDTIDTSLKQGQEGASISATKGFNAELFVRKQDSFLLWDICGDVYHRQFWANYLKNIPVTVIVFVIKANETVEKLEESRLYLH